MKFDFREHKDLIRRLVSELNEKDENWKWTVKAINKTEVRIAWSYLDYDRDEYFKLTVEDWSDEEMDEKPGDIMVLTGSCTFNDQYYREFVRHAGLEFCEVPFKQAIRGAIRSIGYAASIRF